ncbi:MAG: cell division protein FtsA [Sphingobium sp.]|nr:cell division protein FtsA [Sphingobium sp.]MBP6112176.1 cell division protein FtsA [Sphingobium sp.]MBP8670352.1 cell division protein FtsA [Sphingobium sp.]MBP9157686.1 cell division protein FtsA [Sphingobium sp.]MCC6482859.1 cell division protein FtsA [Sphingomonadaceae bacterium]
MAAPGKRTLITVVDIGSWKISALIAAVNEAGELEVLGTGQRESRGVRRGFIADMERTEVAIRETVEQAERVAGSNIEDVWVGFSGGNLVSDVVSVERVLGGYRVEQSDIDDLLDLARDSINPAGKVVLHAQPACYTINGNEGVRKPEGMHADRLGVDIHVVMADGAPLANMEACVRGAYLNVQSIVAAPMATGMACLSEEERDLGVALVELGAGMTNVSVYAGGVLLGMYSIPMGASDITDDIASAFGIRRSQAERVKCFYGSAMQNPRDFREMIEIVPNVAEGERSDGGKITRAALVSVICERLDQILSRVNEALTQLGFGKPAGRQVVLTGGGAEMKAVADYAQGALGRTVRIARPRGLVALPEAHAGPAFATLVGLALYGHMKPLEIGGPGSAGPRKGAGDGKGGWWQRLTHALKKNY